MLQDNPATLIRARRPADRHIAAAYLHIPFCLHKCHYCDFYSLVDHQDRQSPFIDRLIDEIAAWADLIDQPLRSLFVGGGTPTLLRTELWKRLLTAIEQALPRQRHGEFSVEANPETLSAELLDVLVAGGVNRLSLGVQSFNRAHLKTLERWHEPDRVVRACCLARQAGLTNINLDLIFAIPGQTLDDWLADLRTAVALAPTHLSCYALTWEPDTPLMKKLVAGEIRRCDEDLEAAMYEATIDTLAAVGFDHYEISNWAAAPTVLTDRSGQSTSADPPPSWRCRHNLAYWYNDNYLAFGPAAAGHIHGLRWKNTPDLVRYLDSTGPAPAGDIEQLDPDRSLGEQLMLRLRLVEGVERTWLQPRLDADRSARIDQLVARGLLEQSHTHLRLTRRGLLLADHVLADLL